MGVIEFKAGSNILEFTGLLVQSNKKPKFPGLEFSLETLS
jgi:hypothetical protein